MKEVFLVLQNVDFTEGRGPMRNHSVWNTWEDANSFIMDRYGIMGTEQHLYKEGFLTDSKKGQWYYNGYEIRKVPVFEAYDKNDFDPNGNIKGI